MPKEDNHTLYTTLLTRNSEPAYERKRANKHARTYSIRETRPLVCVHI